MKLIYIYFKTEAIYYIHFHSVTDGHRNGDLFLVPCHHRDIFILVLRESKRSSPANKPSKRV